MLDKTQIAIVVVFSGLLVLVVSGSTIAQTILLQNSTNQNSPGKEGWVRHADNSRQWVNAGCRDRLESAGIVVKVVNYAVIASYPKTSDWLNCEDIEAVVNQQKNDSGNDDSDKGDSDGVGFVMMQNGPNQPSPGNEGWVRHPDNTRQWVDAACRVRLEKAGMVVNALRYEVIGSYPKTSNWMRCDDIVKAIGAGDGGGGDDDSLVMLQNSRSQPSPGSQGWVKYTDNTRQWVNPQCRETLEAAGMPVKIVNYDYVSQLPKTENWRSCLDIRLALDDTAGGGSSGSGSGSGGTVRASLSVKLTEVPEAPAFVAGVPQSAAANAEIKDDPRGTSNNRSDLEGAFRIQCKISEDAHQDPVVKFGQDNAAHHHLFFGNARIDELSTNDPRVSSSQSIQRQQLYRYSCHGGRANQSGYWTPVVYDQSGNPRMPKGMVGVYYKTVAGQSGANLESFPQGLQMIAGNPGSMVPKSNWGMRIGCGGSGYFATIQPTQFQYCDPASQTVDMFIRFPNCWNGVDLTDVDNDGDPANDDSDAADDPHSHMRYSGGAGSRFCPTSHPIQLPIVSYNFRYELQPGDDSSRWYLASDLDMATGKRNRPGGSSWHGDWVNGWEPAVMEEWMNGCVRPNRHCANGDMGQRQLASPPPSSRTKHISEYDAAKDAFYQYRMPMNSNRSDWRATIDSCGSSGKGPLSFDFSAELNCERVDGKNTVVRVDNAQLAAHGLDGKSCGTHQLDLLSLGRSVGYETTNGKTPCSISSFAVTVTDSAGHSDSVNWSRALFAEKPAAHQSGGMLR